MVVVVSSRVDRFSRNHAEDRQTVSPTDEHQLGRLRPRFSGKHPHDPFFTLFNFCRRFSGQVSSCFARRHFVEPFTELP